MPKYELVVILDTNRPEDQTNASLDKIEEVITNNGGTIESRDVWGKRRLAYPINRRRDGHYTLITFETASDNQCLAELNRHLRITEEVMRSMVTVAVVGKSRGNPPSDEARGDWRAASFRASQAARERRGDRGDRGGDRRPPRDAAPREEAPAAEQPAATTES